MPRIKLIHCNKKAPRLIYPYPSASLLQYLGIYVTALVPSCEMTLRDIGKSAVCCHDNETPPMQPMWNIFGIRCAEHRPWRM